MFMTLSIEQQMQILFAKIGGTWDMDVYESKLKGVGNLGDEEIHKLMEQRGLLHVIPKAERIARERDFALYLYGRFKNTQPLDVPVDRYFAPWCPEFGSYVTGEFYSLFSGDSSHLTHPFNAAITTNLIERRLEDPKRLVAGAQGTDTADVAFLALLDALTFDTELPPTYFTGANRSRHEENSDAPDNFLGLARIAQVNPELYLPDLRYPSGAFWSFHKYLYAAADVAKFDPTEERIFQGQDTFFSPNSYAHLSGDTLTVFRVNKERGERRKEVHPYQEVIGTGWLYSRDTSPLIHVTRRLTAENLYDALCSVHTVDLGNQNQPADDIEKILDPSYKAVIVAAHSLGNGPEQIRAALVEAAKQEKVVIVTSRTFIPGVSQRYEESLLSANYNARELGMSRYRIISGQHLSRTAARAVAVRSILEGLNQVQTEQLLNEYCEARPPQYGKEIQLAPSLVSSRTSGRGRVAVLEGQTPVKDSYEEATECARNFVHIWSYTKSK